MNEDLRILIKTILDADEEASVKKIISKIPSIEKSINSKSNIKVKLDIDTGSGNNSFSKRMSDDINSLRLIQDKSILTNRIDTWMNRNTKAAKVFGEQLEKLKVDIDGVTNNKQITELNRTFRNIQSQASSQGLLGKTVGQEFTGQISKLSSWLSVGNIILSSTNSIQSVINNVIELDTAMVELRKVTDAADSEFSAFLDRAKTKAVELSTSLTDLVNATSNFSRLGYSLEESEQLGQVATIYANVGDDVDNIDDATSSIISTMKAFNVEADNSISIVDKFNEVGNKFSISSGGIGDALQRSASSLSSAGNTLSESIGLITAANTVVQDPESVGTAFKTLSMRIRGATTELEAAGLDTEGMAESTAKLREEILALSGVDIMADKNTFKSTYDILDELASKWQDLTDIQQAAITELIAGSNVCQYVQKCA